MNRMLIKNKIEVRKRINFVFPQFLVDILIKDFYLKEPETLEWIDNFKKEK